MLFLQLVHFYFTMCLFFPLKPFYFMIKLSITKKKDRIKIQSESSHVIECCFVLGKQPANHISGCAMFVLIDREGITVLTLKIFGRHNGTNSVQIQSCPKTIKNTTLCHISAPADIFLHSHKL